MSIIDFIVYTDQKSKIEEIKYYGEKNTWYHSIPWNTYLGEDIHEIFVGINTGNIIEFKNKLFKYQIIQNDHKKKIVFSSESLMKTLYEEALNKVSDGIQIYNRNGFFLYSNPSSEKLEKYNKEDFLGKHILDLYNLTEDYSTTLTVLQSKKPVLNRCDRFKTREGEQLVTMNSGYPIVIDKNIYGAVVFESDLSIVNRTKDRLFNFEEFIRDETRKESINSYTFSDIIHNSKVMEEKIEFAKKIALTNTNVLLTGETGTGKELFAQSIHQYSSRKDCPFIDVNCSAIPNNLIESYFFGTEKGSFTGSENKIGFFEQADGGTLFLDEINSISKEAQAKLLRVIQEKKYQKVGSKTYEKCNVRIIAASNENMRELMENNQIRKDFYYRIAPLSIFIPKLKERREDIRALIQFFLETLGEKYYKLSLNISERVYQIMMGYDWPGNVRELKHILEYAINRLEDQENVIKFNHLPHFMQLNKDSSHKDISQGSTEVKFVYKTVGTLKERLEQYEEELIISSLRQNSNNITKTAKKLGLSRQSLQYRLKKYQVEL